MSRKKSPKVTERPARVPGVESPRRPRVVLAEPDPYLSFLIRQGLREVDVVEAHDPEGAEGLMSDADVLVVDLARRPAPDLGDGTVRVVGIVDREIASQTAVASDLDGLLVRPFLPSELYRTLRRSLGMGGDGEGAELGAGRRFSSWLGTARVVAIAAGAVFELATPEVSPERALILAGAFAYVAARLRFGRSGARGAWADVAVAAGLLAATGGLTSSYLGFGAVAAAQIGFLVGPGPGLLAAVVIGGGSTPSLISTIGRGADPASVVLSVAFYPVAALIGTLSARIWRTDEQAGSAILAEANEVLSALYRIARTIPGSLDLGNVATATMDELRETLGAPAGALLVGDAGMFVVAGSYGLSLEGSIAIQGDDPQLQTLLRGGVRAVEADDLPEAAGADAHACWLVAPLHSEGVATGLLLSACVDHDRHDADRLVLQQLRRETTVAVENVRLFARVGALSANEERKRLARELHDGVAQALAHVHLELDLLARDDTTSPETVREETSRLARVVGRALEEVRTTIFGLRAAVADGGLAEALGAYLRDVEGLGGPRIAYRTRGEIDLPVEVADEVFRIAQEAVSNAVRHAKAREVRVTLEHREPLVLLEVADDGTGLPPGAGSGRGLGLAAMQERAKAVGGRLRVGPGRRGGTKVALLVNDTIEEGGPGGPVHAHEELTG